MRRYRTSKLSSDKTALEHLDTVKAELTRRKLSISEFSRQLNIDKRVVYQWVVGYSYPIPENYNKLADFFGWPHFKEGEYQ